jgi:predicted nucleic acid-binding protein
MRIVISNSSPLLALGQIQRLDILKQLFGHIYIPDSVYQETVIKCRVPVQREAIIKAIYDFIEVVTPSVRYSFSRNLGKGEQGVLNLAIEQYRVQRI